MLLLKSKEFKEACSTILAATDSSELSTLTETLELKAEGKVLYLNVTNKEYYCSVKFNLDQEESFHATVNASLFLKLIAAVTSEAIELNVQTNYVSVKANGNYKIPLIFKDDKLLEVPAITIDNVTNTFTIGGEILDSIMNYNSKELLKGTQIATCLLPNICCSVPRKDNSSDKAGSKAIRPILMSSIPILSACKKRCVRSAAESSI